MIRPRRTHTFLVATTATLILALAAGIASANRFSVTNRNFRATWRALRIEPGEVKCAVTLEGSFHSATINKTLEALVGHVSRGIVKNEACTNGNVTILQEALPWHVRYGGFSGSLPRPSRFHLRISWGPIRVSINFFGVSCVVKAPAGTGTVFAEIERAETGAITGFSPDETSMIPLTGGCEFFGNASFSGREGRLTLLGNATTITVKLI